MSERIEIVGEKSTLERTLTEINRALGYPLLADDTCRRGEGEHVPLEYCHTISSGAVAYDEKRRVWTLDVRARSQDERAVITTLAAVEVVEKMP